MLPEASHRFLACQVDIIHIRRWVCRKHCLAVNRHQSSLLLSQTGRLRCTGREGGTCSRPRSHAPSTQHRSLPTCSPSLPASAEGEGGQVSVEGFAIFKKNKGFNSLQPLSVPGCPRLSQAEALSLPRRHWEEEIYHPAPSRTRGLASSTHNKLGLSQKGVGEDRLSGQATRTVRELGSPQLSHPPSQPGGRGRRRGQGTELQNGGRPLLASHPRTLVPRPV